MRIKISIYKKMIIVVFLSLLIVTSPFAASWNPMPDSGQVECYDGNGNEIICTAKEQPLHGQDAQYHGPGPSFTIQTINNDVIVVDNNTNLIWQQNTADVNGDNIISSADYPTGDRMTWQESVDYCIGMSYAGFSDWRLPTFTELDSIVDYGTFNPAINTVYFQCEPSNYWSITPYVDTSIYAWDINFYSGDSNWTYSKSYHEYVRCVREH